MRVESETSTTRDELSSDVYRGMVLENLVAAFNKGRVINSFTCSPAQTSLIKATAVVDLTTLKHLCEKAATDVNKLTAYLDISNMTIKQFYTIDTGDTLDYVNKNIAIHIEPIPAPEYLSRYNVRFQITTDVNTDIIECSTFITWPSKLFNILQFPKRHIKTMITSSNKIRSTITINSQPTIVDNITMRAVFLALKTNIPIKAAIAMLE